MQLSVRAKIILIVMVILIVAIGTQIVANSIVFSDEYSDALKSKAVVIGKGLKLQLNRLLRLGISIDDLVGFEKQCQDTVSSYEEISHAMVISPEGVILFHNDPAQMGSVLSDPKILEAVEIGKESIHVFAIEGKNYYMAIIPVFDTSEEYVGAVGVDFPEELITKKTETLIFHSILLSLIFFTFTIILMIVAISTWVTKPLRKLVTVIQDINRSGNLDKKVQIHSKDELGELAFTFNQMTRDLKLSKRKLEEHSRTLEDRVKERTSELTTINETLKTEIAERRKAEEAVKNAMRDLERFNRLAVGREMRMIELKREVNDLLGTIGRQEKYRIHTSENVKNTIAEG